MGDADCLGGGAVGAAVALSLCACLVVCLSGGLSEMRASEGALPRGHARVHRRVTAARKG